MVGLSVGNQLTKNNLLDLALRLSYRLYIYIFFCLYNLLFFYIYIYIIIIMWIFQFSLHFNLTRFPLRNKNWDISDLYTLHKLSQPRYIFL